jgi:formylglycine-generating enzyme required for sulfatase activity
MPSFQWLHLCDLHQGQQGQSILWPNLRQALFEDLSRLHDRAGPWDFVLFSGDLVQRGAAREYEVLDEALGRLWAHLASLGSRPLLLPVPGNHDLVRPREEDPARLVLENWWERENIRRLFWEEPDSPYRRCVAEAFANYTAWWSASPLPRPETPRQGILPGDLAHVFEKDGLRLGVVALNSAWLQLGPGPVEGRLDLDPRQLHHLLGGDPVVWFEDLDAALLLTHHATDTLHPRARLALQGEISPPDRFLVHFFGHMHEASGTTVSVGGAAARRLWQGASLFGLETLADGCTARSHGYTACRFRVERDEARLSFWPRLAIRHQAGHLHLVAHPGFSLEDGGALHERVALRRPLAAPVAPPGPGLSRLAREYLANSRALWLAGATGLRAAEDLGGEDAFYHADLYVPPSGGVLRRVAATRPPRIVGEGPLLAFLDAPRLLITGQPGSGRSLFLTRLAATLASLALGRQPDPGHGGPDAEALAALRRPDGSWPVPVFLEARTLAEAEASQPGPRSLLLSLAETLARGSGLEAPSSDALREGLVRGEWLLLVDGLDEIADPRARSAVLQRLRGLADPDAFPRTRFVVTARPARHTGSLLLGDEISRVDLLPFGDAEIREFCLRWSRIRRTDPDDLLAARAAFDASLPSDDEERLTANPLFLTMLCHLTDRFRTPPDTHGRLCALLVDQLLARDDAPSPGDPFDADRQRATLEALALAMQEDGTSHWPLDRVHALLLDDLPATVRARERVAATRLERAGGPTGLLRFRHPKEGAVEVRFWHPLLQSWLAACQVARDTRHPEALPSLLASLGRHQDPRWTETIRLLPRALGSPSRARAFVKGLLRLAGRESPAEARVLLLASLAALESGDLLPEALVTSLRDDVLRRIRTRGDTWSTQERLDLLETLGRLTPGSIDPRAEGAWVEHPAALRRLGDEHPERSRFAPRPRDMAVPAFRLARFPVTVGEHARFVRDPDRLDPLFWPHAPASERRCVDDVDPIGWRLQLLHPSRPIVGVSFYEALAFTRWRQARNQEEAGLRLPGEHEWEAASRPRGSGFHPWGDAPPGQGEEARANGLESGLGRPNPVGAFPPHRKGACEDMAGNVSEWCSTPWRAPYTLEIPSEPLPLESRVVIRGGAFDAPASALRCASRAWRNPGFRFANLGFRLAIGDP